MRINTISPSSWLVWIVFIGLQVSQRVRRGKRCSQPWPTSQYHFSWRSTYLSIQWVLQRAQHSPGEVWQCKETSKMCLLVVKLRGKKSMEQLMSHMMFISWNITLQIKRSNSLIKHTVYQIRHMLPNFKPVSRRSC